MAEDEIVELLWEKGQLVRRTHTRRPTSDKPSPPPILRGSGSGAHGIENDPLPQPPPSHHNLFIQDDEIASWLHHPHGGQEIENAPLSLQQSDQNLFIQEDEMASWLIHPYDGSNLLYSSNPVTHPPQSSISLAPPPTTTQTIRPNFMNFSTLISRLEAGQVDSSKATESCLTPATESRWTAHGFPIPGLTPKGKAVAADTVCHIGGTSTPKAEAKPTQLQLPATETGFADDWKRKESVDIIEDNKARRSTSRKRSRAAEMHNMAERRRREKINEKMKALQQFVLRCSKSDKVSMLEAAIDYVKSLQQQIQIMSTGATLLPTMYPASMQQFMPQMAMGLDQPQFIPFPRTTRIGGVGQSYPPPPRLPFPNIQTSDQSRVHLPPTQQLNPVLNQPQFMGYMNPYSQFAGLHQMQQPPPPLQTQTTSQLSFSQASSSKKSEDQKNQPTG